MKIFNKFCDMVNKFYAYIGLTMLVVISIACIMQVFTRYILGDAIVGTEELSRYCFIWLGFLGGAVCVHGWSNAHISVLNDALKNNARKVHTLFLNIMVFICAAILFSQGLKCVHVTANQMSSMMKIPMSYVYAAIPIGSFGMMLFALQRMLKVCVGSNKEEVQE